MEVVHPNCCGLDVHKQTVVASRWCGEQRQTRTFGTTTRALQELADWLLAGGCTHVAMESTGSFWKPVYNILEGRFTLVVVNSRDLKIVAGRKTDVKDAEWIADLLRVGLLKGSFVPSRDERELRELGRYRDSLVKERSAEINRIQKVLEGANIKLASVASNVVGASGRAILRSLVAGAEDGTALSELAKGKLRAKQDRLAEALEGLVQPHQRFMLRQQLRHIDELDRLIDEVTTEIERRLAPFADAQERLQTIPGIGPRVAQVVLCETAAHVERFPTARHFASWAGLCPGLNESAGHNRSGRTTKGSRWLRTSLIQAAHAAGRTRSALGEEYRRLRARIGAKKAAVAVAHSIVVIIYRLLTDGTVYHEQEPARREQLQQRATAAHVRALKRLGWTVSLTSEPAA
jgi:transposase